MTSCLPQPSSRTYPLAPSIWVFLKARLACVEEALAALKIEDLRGRPTHMLSGGQKKRVAIAGAIAIRPGVLLLLFSTHEVDLA